MMIPVRPARRFPLWIVRRAPLFLLVAHLPFGLAAPLYTITGLAGPSGDPLLVVPLAAVVTGLQLRHSAAATRSQRPAYWPWSFAALLALVYGPLSVFSWNWAAVQVYVVASALMLLRGWLAAAFVAAPVLGTAIAVWYYYVVEQQSPVGTVLAHELYWVAGLVIWGGSLFGASRIIQVIGELYAARTELAEIAIGRDRVRISRDLHDLLGQSLSAVSLKGDLAIRLLRRDTDRARAEIEGLTELARMALHDVRRITRAEHLVSLYRELDAAATLADAAGIACQIDADVVVADPRVEEVLAWTVREGTTNMLRHSDAHRYSITLLREDGVLRLTILNDGIREMRYSMSTSSGTGLDGLRERAQAVSGVIDAGRRGDGWFRLEFEAHEAVVR